MATTTLLEIAKKYIGSSPKDLNLVSWPELQEVAAKEMEDYCLRIQREGEVLNMPLFKHHVEAIIISLRTTAENSMKISQQCASLGKTNASKQMFAHSIELEELATIIERRLTNEDGENVS